MSISIDLGLKSYTIEDAECNEVGVIRFNPSDPGLLARWEEASEQMRLLAKEPVTDAAGIAELDKRIKEQMDYAFGTPVSGVLFQSVSSLAMCANGKMVLENVLSAFEPIIKEAMTGAAKASAQRMRKYTEKYENTDAGLAPGQK